MSDENKIKLTDKQEKFCNEYLIDLNATQAAKRAGYSEKTAHSIGFENLIKPEIQDRLAELKKELAKKVEVTAEMLTREWKKIAFSKFSDIHNSWIERKRFEDIKEENPDILDCIEFIDTKILKKNIGSSESPEIVDVEHIKIKLFSKERALENLGKRTGYYELDNKQKSPKAMTEEDKLDIIKKIKKADE